jgi:hypothetical protein
MSTQKLSPEKFTLLQHIERIIDLSEKNVTVPSPL